MEQLKRENDLGINALMRPIRGYILLRNKYHSNTDEHVFVSLRMWHGLLKIPVFIGNSFSLVISETIARGPIIWSVSFFLLLKREFEKRNKIFQKEIIYK